MKFSAIIVEYNPLTNGHLHHIKQTKKALSFPIICIMSGNFVQRGEVAILDKYTRAKHAILAGADIVIELPAVFALSSAQDFALGAIKTLNSIGSVEYLSFGSESGNLEGLTKAAEELLGHRDNQNSEFKLASKSGSSYATSVLKSVSKETSTLISKPNNILAIEYIKALIETKSKIQPFTIFREDNYNNNKNNSKLPSASAVRTLLFSGKNNKIKKIVPTFVYNDLKKVDITAFNHFKDFSLFNIKHKEIKYISDISEVVEGLEFRLKDTATNSVDYTDFAKKSYTKRYKNSKIDRIVLKSALNITKGVVITAKKIKPYIKVLAVSKENKGLLKFVDSKKSTLITKKKDYENLCRNQTQVVKRDLQATALSSTVHKSKSNSDFGIGTLIV